MSKVPFKVRALYEYKSEHEDDLNFAPGTIITVTNIEDDEWYTGEHGSEKGMFPKNFVEPIAEEPAAPKAPERPKASAPESGPQEPLSTSSTGNKEPSETHEQIEPPKVATKTETAKVPKPAIFPGPSSQRNDPYAVKKQFAGAGKSSYVPEVKPRDSYNIVGHAHHDVAENTEVVREHDNKSEEEEADEPKMSLKERIAMLQKRQQEEAEREAAALKRKEERKKKMQEEKERLKQQKEAQGQISATSTGASQFTDHEAGEVDSLTEKVVSPVHAHPEAGIPEVPETADDVEEEEIANAEEAEDEEEDEEDEEDEEELKRRRLVERMAKISGGRNMFGMMGMATPFGAPAPATKPKKKRSTSQGSDAAAAESSAKNVETATEAPATAPSIPGAIPMPGMAQSDTLPPKAEETALDNAPVANIKKTAQEDSSIAESDYTDEQNFAVTNENKGYHEVDENKPKSPTLESSESEPESNSRNDDMDLGTRSTLEGEATGYEADEDVSDRGAVPKNDLLEPEVPKSPARPTAPPPIPGGPPPGEPTVDKETTSSSPVHSRAPPPIPNAAPPPSAPSLDPRRTAPPIPGTAPPTDTALAPPLPSSQAPQVPPPVPQEVPSTSVSRTSTGTMEPPIPSRAPPSPTEHNVPPSSRLPPPPPVPSAPAPLHSAEHQDDVSDADDELRDVSFTHSGKAPERVSTFSHAPPIPQVPIARANTVSSTGRTSGEHHRKSSTELSRTRSGKAEQLQADHYLAILQEELKDVDYNSGWWVKDAIPESFQSSLGTDFIFEVDHHKLRKRGNREVVYKDYYILFHDLSQIIVELQYDSDDPRTTLSVSNAYVKPPVVNRRDMLDKYHAKFGNAVVETAQKLVNSRTSNGFVNAVFQRVNDASAGSLLAPIGNKSYGVTVYKNQNGAVTKFDEVRPGDILCMKNAKFTTHGLGGLSTKTVTYGEGSHVYSGVIVEIDHKKDKLRVLDSDDSGAVKKESFKLNDLKSGRVRVFRFVDRHFVGW